jgi:hypothetical protein
LQQSGCGHQSRLIGTRSVGPALLLWFLLPFMMLFFAAISCPVRNSGFKRVDQFRAKRASIRNHAYLPCSIASCRRWGRESASLILQPDRVEVASICGPGCGTCAARPQVFYGFASHE